MTDGVKAYLAAAANILDWEESCAKYLQASYSSAGIREMADKHRATTEDAAETARLIRGLLK